ncbi:MAG: GAF domain-containing protein [Blastocatellia bacterium]|nr:GAF domain-containing protein [Blastocatellia bacterium]MBL8192945.1 GAF domain-containing protein [Blastocatellia bacterium]
MEHSLKKAEHATKYLIKVIQELSKKKSLEEIMQVVRIAARELTNADGATFVLRDGDNCYYAEENAISPLWKGNRFPMEKCISGWVMKNAQSVIIEDIYQDSRIPIEAYKPTFVKSLAMVPIRSQAPIGAIGNYWSKTNTPSSEEIELLQALADSTSIAMENVQVYSELEQKVKERTLQLELINTELEAFSYSVSHDLRAPLRHIGGFIKLLEKNNVNLDEKSKRYIKIIAESSQTMGILIDELLEFSKMGRQEMINKQIELEVLLNRLIMEQTTIYDVNNIKWIIDKLPIVYADLAMLTVVLNNLISNAIKYSSKQQTPIIEIGCLSKEAEEIIFIKDNGVGFDMEYANKLFGVFQRLHRADEFEGIGIGLATVKRIINRHNGRVWAESILNQGSTFYFALPKKIA